MRDRVLFLILLFSLFPGRGTGEALNDAAAAQRQAIAELIQSLKSARRILSTRPPDPGSGTSGVKPVFRDRQTFLLPEMPPSANPAEQLNARIEEQKRLLDEMRPAIHGMVHCTGGAQTKVLHFVGENCRVVKDNLFPVPPLFKAIARESGTDWAEMYKVFNMGHRLEIYLAPEDAEKAIAISKSFDIDAQVVGRIEEGPRSLTIRSEFGEFHY